MRIHEERTMRIHEERTIRIHEERTIRIHEGIIIKRLAYTLNIIIELVQQT